MTWLDRLPPLQESSPEVLPDDLAVAREYGMEVAAAPETGPTVETRQLLRRLYGEPQDCDEPNPYLAGYTRFRAKLHPAAGASPADVHGSIDYRHWPDLKLGYIENVHVGPDMRRRGVGVRLLGFAVEHLRRRGSRSIHAFTVNSQGFGLFTSAGFAAGPPEDLGSPWRRWVSTE